MNTLSIVPSSLPAPEPAAQTPTSLRNELQPWSPSPFAQADGAVIGHAAQQVEMVEGLEAVSAIEAQWQELAPEAIEPNPFYEPWMVIPALQRLSGPKPIFALVWAPHPSGRKGERILT